MKRGLLKRLTPLKRTPMKRRAKRNPVPADLRPYIGARDQECVLSKLDSEHVCRDTFGNRIPPDYHVWEMDHIDNGGLGAKVHEKWNAVRLCPMAHYDKTMNPRKYRPDLRRYARRVEGLEVAA